MDVDSGNVTDVDDWLACFSLPSTSKPGAFPFTSRKIQSIESRRARMSDLLIFDVLLVRGGIRSPDMLFPPADWTALRKLLDAIDGSVYDILKKDCLVYILLKWVWDIDTKESNPGWQARYLQDRCVAPQFATLADAYWLLDTGTHLARAVSILSDTRLNKDYVSKVLQALALSSSPNSFTSGTAPDTAALIVKYVRTAKPLLIEPDDVDLYALSLAQLSFMDAWAYQKSFPEESDTRERLLKKIVGWCLMPTPKREPLAQLLSFPLSSYEQSCLHLLALPSQFSTSSLSGVNTHTTAPSSGPVLSSQAVSVLQDLLCVRAIQYGDFVGAIKLDRQFSSVLPLGSGASTSQVTSSGRDVIDRRSIIHDLFATLPPAERTLLEDEFGKVATGIRPNASTPRQGPSATRRPLRTEMSLSASWEDIGAGMGSPAPSASLSASAVGPGFVRNATPVPVSASISASPLAPRAPRPQLVSVRQAPPTPKFTAFGSPIPASAGVGMGRGVVSERSKSLFSTSATVKPATHASLFETTGSAKNAPNAFYTPPSAPRARASLDVGSALAGSSAAKSATQRINAEKQNGKARGSESDGEDVSMESKSDVEAIEENYRVKENHSEEVATDEEDDTENFITYDKSGATDFSLHRRDVDEVTGEDDGAGLDLGFSVFSRSAAQNSSAGKYGRRSTSKNGHVPYVSPPRPRVSPSREGEESLSMSVESTTSRWRAPPGAFHQEEEDHEQEHGQNEKEDKDENEGEDEEDKALRTTPASSPRRSTRTRMQAQTPSRTSARSQHLRSSKHTRGLLTHTERTPANRLRASQPIPGALIDEDNDEQGQDGTDYMDACDDRETEMDEQEEDDAIRPLPSRRTRSSGHVGASATSTESKPSAKATAPVRVGPTIAAKGKAKLRPSEAKTPARRSSRLSTASSLSPDRIEAASPTKKGRKSAGPRASVAASGSGTITTRSSSRRKR